MNIPKYEDTEPIVPKYEETEPIEQKTALGFGKNLWEDVKGTAVGVGGLAKGLMTEPVETVTDFATGIGPALFKEGQRIGVGKLLTGHPIKAASQFGEALYEKPLTTTLDVLPAAGAAGKALGFGGKAARGAKLAAEAGEAAELAKGAELAGSAQAGKVAPILEEAAGVAKAAPTLEGIAAGPWAKTQEAFSQIKSKIPPVTKGPLEEAMGWTKEKYGDVVKKTGIPKAAETASKYLIDIGRDLTAKQ